ncbi:MAG: GTP 3',8-cyclase MoaA [Hyphomicrobiaceae bacterium]|nr:GTP 3',8-cyclase MoaA [Hyphomicrobiaceae bacterium]
MDKPVFSKVSSGAGQLMDPFHRQITYLRLSVTDRCDLRCTYCMDENVRFVPRREVLSLEELDRLASSFVALGVRKIRLTGGEPLVRKGIDWLVQRLGRHLQSGALDELTMTSNGTQLPRYAAQLAGAGIKRINISLDSRDPQKFREISRIGELSSVLKGIDAALEVGLKVKINMVAIKGFNEDEIAGMMVWAHEKGMDLTLIEVMPFGDGARWLPNLIGLDDVRVRLGDRFTLEDIPARTGGPARYVKVRETGGLLGLITPMSGNFCDGCNRIRVTCRGRLYQCLGHEQYVDLRATMQEHEDDEALKEAIHQAIAAKPKGHDFAERRSCGTPNVKRDMSSTGG